MTQTSTLSASPSNGSREAIALAREAPLSQGAVRDLAKKLGPALARDAAVGALDAAGANAAMVLAFAAAAAGAKLPPELVRALLPEVSSLDHVGPLVHAADGSPLDVLAAFLGDARGDLELECLAMLLAADALRAADALEAAPTIPAVMLTRGRWLARHQLSGDASLYLGAAASRIKDADLLALATPHVNRARRAKKTIEEALATAELPPLEVLDDAEGARVSTGFTVRHEAPSVGRNDPCPCGSGKKYKKCHALAPVSPAATAAPKLDAATLGPDQVALLRPSEIAALDTARLSPKAFLEAFHRVVDFRRWDLALGMIAQAKARKELGKDADASALVLDALRGAYEAGAGDAAEELHALLPPDLAGREALALECLRAPADLLARIEREAEEALRTDADGARGMLLASALLRWFPALGIYVARGALHEGRTRDSQALLQRIEDARDRLLLSPFEAWWDVYDAFFESSDERREQKKDDARREKMKEDLRRARAASRKASAELEKIQERVAELDATLAPSKRSPASTRGAVPKAPGAPDAPAAPGGDLAEERRRLKTKVEELQRIIGEGQDERRELRRQLADREDDEPEAPSRPQKGGPKSDDPEREPEGMHDAGAIDLPRGILVPRFSERASKALEDLAADAADGVLGLVAALAAGKPNAWGGVKQLTKARGVLSARAGIHHRVLFSTQDRALEVLEVIHRRDLEQTVARLARGA